MLWPRRGGAEVRLRAAPRTASQGRTAEGRKDFRMSASLIVLIPIVLLGVVTALCFVGCVLHTYGLPPSFTAYSQTTVLGNPNNIAYWPLNETADTQPAHDLKGNNNGKYIDPNTAPPGFYPWPSFSIPNPPNPDTVSAAGQGILMFGQPGIVTGDFGLPPSVTQTKCILVDGAFVAVPFTAVINPTPSFTLECWVQVGWSSTDPLAFRAVVDCRNDAPGQGFALFAAPDADQSGNYHWQASIGNGGAGAAAFTPVTSADPPIALSDDTTDTAPTTFYLAVTFDGSSQTLLLFVNGQEVGKTIPATYVANTSEPLWIGAGAPFVPQRPQPPGMLASPLFPWVGAIQDVALYSAALGGDVIKTHFDNGGGNNP
jgi:Concanavalin A-like lectin/glucanases superfamily